MLDLSRCTLLFVETRAHKITKRVIEDCLKKATFGDVLIYTDKMEEFAGLSGIRLVPCKDFPNKKEAGQFYYSEAMAKVETDFALMMEWDAGIIDPANWSFEFFNYDYVGAPWNTSDDLKVGNGGFTLMSKRLGHFLCYHRSQFPVFTDWDVCRTQRRGLEQAGDFKWAPFDIAQKFSWELAPRSPTSFGYHGAFHWHSILSREELATRATFLTETPYLLSKMRDIFRYDPVLWLKDAIDPVAWAKFHAVHPVIPAPRRERTPANVILPNRRHTMLQLLAERQAAANQTRGLKA